MKSGVRSTKAVSTAITHKDLVNVPIVKDAKRSNTIMSHLNDVEMTYFQHLSRASKIAFVLIVHGLFPNIWKTKASEMICTHK